MSLESTSTSGTLRQAVTDVQDASEPSQRAAAALRCAASIEAAQAALTNSLGVPDSDPAAAWVKALVDSLYASFETCSRSARAVAASCEDSDEAQAAALLELEEDVASLIDRVAQYESYLYTTGPSRFPVQNALARAAGALLEGQLQPAGFAEIVGKMRSYFASTADEARQMAVSEPDRAELASALVGCAAALDEVARYLEASDRQHLDRGFAQLFKAQEQVEAHLERHPMAQPAGPTSSPLINAYLQAAFLLSQGKLDRKYFAEQLKHLTRHVELLRGSLRPAPKQAAQATESSDAQQRLGEAVEQYEQAVQHFEAWLHDRDHDHLEAACSLLVNGTAALDEARSALTGSSHSQVLCPHCGAQSAGDATHCESCDHALPRVTFTPEGVLHSDSGDPGVPLTDHLFRLLDDTNRALNQTISPQAYGTTLGWAQALVNEHLAQARRIRPADPARFGDDEREEAERVASLVTETRDLLEHNLEMFAVGVVELARYIEDNESSHLGKGLKQVWEAARGLAYAQRVGEMTSQSLTPHSLSVGHDESDESSIRGTA